MQTPGQINSQIMQVFLKKNFFLKFLFSCNKKNNKVMCSDNKRITRNLDSLIKPVSQVPEHILTNTMLTLTLFYHRAFLTH